MILEYHRPTTIAEALDLLRRSDPVTIPLAGGSDLNRQSQPPVAVVDLQALGLNKIERKGNALDVEAMVTLQALLDYGVKQAVALPLALLKSVEHEATFNKRQVATLVGTLMSAGGRSPFTTVMMALDASLTLMPEKKAIDLGDILPFRSRETPPSERLRGRLVTKLSFPLNVHLAYEYVARTPADRPIVCAALACWSSGRTRLALGGFGKAPTLAMDGTGPEGLVEAAQSAYNQAGDEWASAEYRQEMAGVLAKRCLIQISS
jgi:CO/xanthine dehydrogenase FAD-binding subunit